MQYSETSPRLVTKMTTMARSSPTLSLYLKWQKIAPLDLDKCISMLAATPPSTSVNPFKRVPAIMTTSAILMEAYSIQLNPTAILPTLKPVPFGYTVESKFKFSQTNPNECLHVADYALTTADLQTLRPKQWLNDQVVDAFLKLSSKESNDQRSPLVYSNILPSYLAAQWANGDYNTHLFLKVSLLKYQIIILPVCNHDHWFLLVAFPRERKIYVLDSKENVARQETLFSHWRKFMYARQKRQNLKQIQWTLNRMMTSQQEDGDSCGVFVLMNATAILKNRHPRIFRQCHVDGFRKFVSHKLFSNAAQ